MSLNNEWLKQQIESMELPCAVSVFAGSDKTCLIVAMGDGPDGEPQSAQLWLQPQDLEEPGEEVSLLHVFIPICRSSPDHLPDVAGFLIGVNVGLDIPGFGISPQDQYVYYHATTFLTPGRSRSILQALLGIAFTYVDGFNDAIKDIALGRKTTQQAVQKMMETARGAGS